MPFMFENLKVYQKSISFAKEISNLTEGFPRGKYYLVDQINRASLSIAANIAEGNGRYHKADRINFFRISRGSAFECVPIIEICKHKGLFKEQEAMHLREKLDDICKMLSGLMNY